MSANMAPVAAVRVCTNLHMSIFLIIASPYTGIYAWLLFIRMCAKLQVCVLRPWEGNITALRKIAKTQNKPSDALPFHEFP